MYIDKRRKTVTLNDIRTLIREEWPTRQQLPLDIDIGPFNRVQKVRKIYRIGPFFKGGPSIIVPGSEDSDLL